MNLVADIVAWFADPANWQGRAGVPVRVLEHLRVTAIGVALAALLAIPVGALVGHTRRGGFLVVGTANGLRALPELGLLTLLVLLVGVNQLPLVIALVVLAVPPLLAGTYSGVSNVDPAVVDAARGMGMREREVLWKVELPMALPLILGGLRTATLQVIATVAIGALISANNLGRYLIDGIANDDYIRMAAGALLIAALALAVEALLATVARYVVSPGLSSGRTRFGPVDPSVTAPDPEPAGSPEPRGIPPERIPVVAGGKP